MTVSLLLFEKKRLCYIQSSIPMDQSESSSVCEQKGAVVRQFTSRRMLNQSLATQFPLMKPFLYFRAAVTALLLLVTIHQEFMLLHRDTGNYKVHLLSRVRKQGICEFIKKINYFNYFMTLSVH